MISQFHDTKVVLDEGEFHAVYTDGIYRVLAALPPRADRGGFPNFAAARPELMLDAADYREFDNTNPLVKVKDQGQHGSCVGNGSYGGFTEAWLEAGNPYFDFSPCYVYGMGNRGRDQGMVVSDAMQILIDDGIALESEVPQGMIYKQQFPASAHTTAARFRIREAYSCGSAAEIFSAVQASYNVVYGILVGARFVELDGEGVPGVGGNGGHCMCSANGMKKSSRWGWLVKNRNSWGTRYGRDGFSWLGKAHFEYGGNLDAFAIKTVRHDPQDRG